MNKTLSETINTILVNNIARQKAEQINMSHMSHLLSLLDPMPDKRFWELITKLQSFIKQETEENGYSYGIKGGCDKLFYHELRDCSLEKFTFVKTYNMKVKAVARKDECWEQLKDYDFFSDDGWYDFTDYLPLKGEQAYNLVLNCKVFSEKTYNKFFSDDNEGYICNTLEKFLYCRVGELIDTDPNDFSKHAEKMSLYEKIGDFFEDW